jgi:hypothetical protein
MIQTAEALFQLAREIWLLADFIIYVINTYKSFPNCLQALKENDFLWINH